MSADEAIRPGSVLPVSYLLSSPIAVTQTESLSLSLSLSLIRVYWKSPATNYAGRGPVLLGPFFKVRILGF